MDIITRYLNSIHIYTTAYPTQKIVTRELKMTVITASLVQKYCFPRSSTLIDQGYSKIKSYHLNQSNKMKRVLAWASNKLLFISLHAWNYGNYSENKNHKNDNGCTEISDNNSHVQQHNVKNIASNIWRREHIIRKFQWKNTQRKWFQFFIPQEKSVTKR